MERAGDLREPLHEGVAAFDVAEFVEEHGAKLLVTPLARFNREHESRTENAPHQGNRALFIEQKSDALTDAEPRAGIGKCRGDLFIGRRSERGALPRCAAEQQVRSEKTHGKSSKADAPREREIFAPSRGGSRQLWVGGWQRGRSGQRNSPRRGGGRSGILFRGGFLGDCDGLVIGRIWLIGRIGPILRALWHGAAGPLRQHSPLRERQRKHWDDEQRDDGHEPHEMACGCGCTPERQCNERRCREEHRAFQGGVENERRERAEKGCDREKCAVHASGAVGVTDSGASMLATLLFRLVDELHEAGAFLGGDFVFPSHEMRRERFLQRTAEERL